MKKLEKQIQQLSIAEKILLVENIWDSIAEEHETNLTAKQKKELDRRMALIDSGKATFFTMKEIKAKFKAMK